MASSSCVYEDGRKRGSVLALVSSVKEHVPSWGPTLVNSSNPITSQRPTSKYHHIRGKGFNTCGLRGCKYSVHYIFQCLLISLDSSSLTGQNQVEQEGVEVWRCMKDKDHPGGLLHSWGCEVTILYTPASCSTYQESAKGRSPRFYLGF